MNWITNFVKPKLSAFIKKKEMPENLWTQCEFCHQMIFNRLFEENNHVCTHCDHHMKLPVEKWFSLFFDEKQYAFLDDPIVEQDPLKFKDLKKYTDRLKQYQTQTGHQDASLCAYGYIDNKACVIFAMNFDFLGGSMGRFVGEMFIQGVKKAIELHAPFVAITASGGARMQEAIYSLMQMPKTTVGIEMLRRKKLPYIAILSSPTMGGVTASFAMLADVTIAEKGALIGFTGPRVIEQTIKQKLPDGFQRAEYLLEHGMVDTVVHRKDLKEKLSKILGYLS